MICRFCGENVPRACTRGGEPSECRYGPKTDDVMILKGDALDLISQFDREPDLIVTDPPYAFGGAGGEHALSATVAIVLRESAKRLSKRRTRSR